MPEESPDRASERLSLVSYSVEIQAGLRGTEEPAWYVRAFELEEELSAPWRLAITLIHEGAVEVRTLAGATFRLEMKREHGEEEHRQLHGIVLQAIDLGRFSDQQHVQLRVGPLLARAELSQRSRIFQNTTVVEIARAVLVGCYDGDAFDVSRLQRSDHPLRDYCVQFRETDLAFVQRILAEDGIAFTFDHTGTTEKFVLLDDSSAFMGAGGSVFVGSDADPDPMPLPVATLGNRLIDREHASRFEWRRAMHPNKGVFEQWDWKAAAPFTAEVPEGALPPWVAGEQILFGDRRLAEAELGTGPHLDHSLELLRRHLHRRQRQADLAHGSSNALGLAPGTTFAIEGHPDGDLNQAYYVTRVIHRADCPVKGAHELGAFAGPSYENELECAPIDIPYYPRVRAKPRVFGPETATVVGPAGEEIHTDELGRIQVRMHWDREQRDLDAGTSAWLRVAHAWAGPGWGTMFIPRVGMEVLVAFLDGNPDRPMCVGCVYNGKNTPPYALPDDKTKSTIKSSSTPGGGGSNELRFEDASGSEEVYLHAQKDLVERVENVHRRSVGASEKIAVGGSRSVDVSGSQTFVIGGGQSITVQGKGQGNAPPPDPAHVLHVTGAIEQHATKTVLVEAPDKIVLQCGTTSIELTPGGIKLLSGTGASVDLTAAIAMAASGGAMTMDLDDQGAMKVASKLGSELTVDAGLAFASAEKTKVVVDGGYTAETAAGARFEMTDAIAANAATITSKSSGASLSLTDAAELQGTSRAAMTAGAGVEADAGGVKVTGTQVDVSGAAAVSLVAPNVKIN